MFYLFSTLLSTLIIHCLVYLSVFVCAHRIQKELADITLDPPPNCRWVNPWPIAFFFHWFMLSCLFKFAEKLCWRAVHLLIFGKVWALIQMRGCGKRCGFLRICELVNFSQCHVSCYLSEVLQKKNLAHTFTPTSSITPSFWLGYNACIWFCTLQLISAVKIKLILS